ncbi:SDR family oxidoreductase [Actinomycetospora termitidis]|uniref:SDR family oxidoreductase n=1 Tax=Actinomycetospora termitidis TaxID=3053470 RepID=A0ABT7MDK4_9PSEU|nr:SDR family oxidoreductase [Actinomycetospora sp. Odt1-22]MDL5158746.1 SDR family oxidoreductase [Actinomycetospora sp. Odt1-22]
MDAPVVVITGASSGIGEATARLLAGRGARLVLGARRTDRLEALAGELGGEVRTLTTDVRRREDVAALVDLAVEAFGRLDVVVANAGVSRIGPLDEQTVDDWDAMIDVNLRGVLHAVAAALPVFRAQAAGHLISIVSTSGLKIVPEQVVYAATKNAVRTLSEGLRQEAGPHLRVTAISPGFTATELVDAVEDPELREQYRARMAELGMPADAIARAVAYAMDQPPGVDVGEIVVRPTAQN